VPNDLPNLENKSDHLVLIAAKLARISIPTWSSTFKSFNFLSNAACFVWSNGPNLATPRSSSLGSPDNSKSFISFNNVCLSFAAAWLNTVRTGGNTLSIAWSNSLDTFLALAASDALSPIEVLSRSKNSCVLPLRALNPDAIL